MCDYLCRGARFAALKKVPGTTIMINEGIAIGIIILMLLVVVVISIIEFFSSDEDK